VDCEKKQEIVKQFTGYNQELKEIESSITQFKTDNNISVGPSPFEMSQKVLTAISQRNELVIQLASKNCPK